jgi:hypothetical protein
MELPILLAVDTTENWNRSGTILGESELAFELSKKADGAIEKILLIGDGQPVGPNVERLRATVALLRIHTDGTLAGKGTAQSPLSVTPGPFAGITSRETLLPDGFEDTFSLPGDIVLERLAVVTINGLVQEQGIDYNILAEEKKIVFYPEPEAGDKVTVFYANTTGGK